MSAEEFHLRLKVAWYYAITITVLSVAFIKGPQILEATLTFLLHLFH